MNELEVGALVVGAVVVLPAMLGSLVTDESKSFGECWVVGVIIPTALAAIAGCLWVVGALVLAVAK